MSTMKKHKEDALAAIENLLHALKNMAEESEGEGWSLDTWGDLKDAIVSVKNVESALEEIPENPDAKSDS